MVVFFCAAAAMRNVAEAQITKVCPSHAHSVSSTSTCVCDSGYHASGQTCYTDSSSRRRSSSVYNIPIISPVGCDWARLPAQVAGAESACCLGLAADLPWPAAAGAASGCGGLAPPTCSVDCAVKLVPLVNGSCAPLLGEIFDAADGARDGDHPRHSKRNPRPPARTSRLPVAEPLNPPPHGCQAVPLSWTRQPVAVSPCRQSLPWPPLPSCVRPAAALAPT